MNTDDLINDGNRCTIPWLHTEINLQNNDARPCCKYTSSLGKAEDFIKVWRSEEYQKLRTDIINKIPHANCNACDVSDDAFSYRNFKNQTYRGVFNKEVDAGESLPRVFHISLKNTCNLACRMCKPNISSKFAEVTNKNEYLKNFFSFQPINNRFDFQKLKGSFVNASHITITGGEPLIDDECQELIEMIASESKLLRVVSFSSNMTKYNKNLIEALRKLKARVIINVSIDGPPNIHEYIRYKCKWPDMITNINALKDFAYFTNFNSTISAMNVGYLPELLTSLDDIQRETGIKFVRVMPSPVLQDYLHPGCLPQEVKELYTEKLKTFNDSLPGSKQLIQSGIDLMKEQYDWNKTKKFLTEFDKVAGTDFRVMYPEWQNY